MGEEGPLRLHHQHLPQPDGPGHIRRPGQGRGSPLPGRERGHRGTRGEAHNPEHGGNPAGGIHVLPEYAMGVRGEGIPDPYGLTKAAYRSTLRQLYEHVERVVRRLEG
jgi:hypothetical protein